MNAFDLKGRVAVVTGGNGGIGLGMARGLAAGGRGGRGRRPQRRQEPERGRRAQDPGRRAVAIEADVAREDAVDALIADVRARFGRLDILVNNAGMNIRKPPQELRARRVAAGDRHQPHQRVPLLAARPTRS